MSSPAANSPYVAIACGGTGGHLFPGLAVADQIQKRGGTVALLISPKDVDQQAVKAACGMEIFTLPAVALQNRNYLAFARSCWQAWRGSSKFFKQRRPDAVLAMGGFTSAPPILVAKDCGAQTFLHESNTIPGKANRFLSRWVDEAFVGFPEAAARLKARKVTVTGTPVRPQFRWGEAPDEPTREDARPTKSADCRLALGLDPDRPVVLVMGGSQGASGLNDLMLAALPALAERASAWQWLHLTGANDLEKVRQGYNARGLSAVVKPFLAEMELALGAATVSVSRSGASSLAEIAAMRLPSLLVPYPTAAADHQLINARAFEKTGAAKLLEQKRATPVAVAGLLCELVENSRVRLKMQTALAQWHAPSSAAQIAEIILTAIAQRQAADAARAPLCNCGHVHSPTKHAH